MSAAGAAGLFTVVLGACGTSAGSTDAGDGEHETALATDSIDDESARTADVETLDTASDLPREHDGAGAPDGQHDAGDTGWIPCGTTGDCPLGATCVPVDPFTGSECLWRCASPDSCPLGFDCRAMVASGGDLESVCVPFRTNHCAVCIDNLDCLNALCTALPEGRRCLSACGACPPGSSCTSTAAGDTCMPDTGSCEGCVDADADRFGSGLLCVGPDCDDARAGVNPDAAELCDLLDNDCDGNVDEDFDLGTDERHCGGCGRPCVLEPGATGAAVCDAGVCELVCPAGFVDCDGDLETGCEANANACGGCAQLEAERGGACGRCAEGTWECHGPDDLRCAEPPGSVANACGGCAALAGTPGDVCGACGLGVWRCAGMEEASCDEPAGGGQNTCGGCTTLASRPGTECGTCGTGMWVCDGEDEIACSGEDPAFVNSCGGCTRLTMEPGISCGPCGADRTVCTDVDTVACSGATTNACGGCGALANPVGAPCGIDMTGAYACAGRTTACHDPVALRLDGADVWVELDAYRLWDGRSLTEAHAANQLCLVGFDGLGDPVQRRVTSVVDTAFGQWGVVALPPLLDGLTPYPGCASCLGVPGATRGLPYQFTFIAGPSTTGSRCAAVNLSDAEWLVIGIPEDLRAPGALYTGPDNLCRLAWTFGVSRLGTSYGLTGERYATGDTSCPMD